MAHLDILACHSRESITPMIILVPIVFNCKAIDLSKGLEGYLPSHHRGVCL